MRYIIAALLLVSGLAPVSAQEQVSVSSATSQGVAVSTVVADGVRKIDPLEYDTPEIKELQVHLDQESREFSTAQMEARTAFLKSISSKQPKEQRKLWNEFQQKQAIGKSAFGKKRRATMRDLSLKRVDSIVAHQRNKLNNKNLSEDERKAYVEPMAKELRDSVETRYARMEEEEKELDKVRADYSLKPERRRKKQEEILEKLAEKHNKEDKAKNEKRAKQLEEQMRKARAQQAQVRQSTATVQQ